MLIHGLLVSRLPPSAINLRFNLDLNIDWLAPVENREKILRTLLSKEKVDEELDFKELATMTEGYSGSDLKNLCITAAYRPVRELIQKERLKDQGKKHRVEEGKASPEKSDNREDKK